MSKYWWGPTNFKHKEWAGKLDFTGMEIRLGQEGTPSSFEWSTPNFKHKGWAGNLDFRDKGNELQKEGTLSKYGWETTNFKRISQGWRQGFGGKGRHLVSSGAHQILNMGWAGNLDFREKGKELQKEGTLSKYEWGTTNSKHKGWAGKLDVTEMEERDFGRKESCLVLEEASEGTPTIFENLSMICTLHLMVHWSCSSKMSSARAAPAN